MQVIAITDIGHGRKVNEDDYFYTQEAVGDLPNLYLVADGLGGHQAGEVASRLAIDSVVKYCLETIEPDLKALFIAAYESANQIVRQQGQQREGCFEMGTTLVGLSILKDRYLIANVGDSRAYLFRNGKLERITKDHSPIEQLQELGYLTEEEAYTHEGRNLISKAIGMEDRVQPDIYELEAEKGDLLMLCTDGLSSFLRRTEMQNILDQDKNLEELAHQLLKTALDQESTDNITLLLVKNPVESEVNPC